MSTPAHLAFPADGFAARWIAWDEDHTEDLSLRWENEAWTATGRVGSHDVVYVIRLSPMWQVRQFMLFRDLDEPDLWLGTDGHGRWGEMNGAHRTDLDGAFDVALAITPFTHALPIRRLPLRIGDAAELKVLDVDVDTLAVVPAPVVYERTHRFTWRVRRGEATTEFDVDPHGLPHDITGAFRRAEPADEPADPSA